MADGGAIAFNSSDPLQMRFLGALAQGESGGSAQMWTEGFGGINLSGLPTDQFGFPQWNGGLGGQTHAAGAFQFQPATWDQVATEHNLNFQSPSDQAAGAWYVAQDTFAANTGGKSLEDALQAGDFSTIQQALGGVWPSVYGNQAAPQGLAANLGSGAQFDLTSMVPGIPGGGFPGDPKPKSLGDTIGGFFVRSALVILGVVIIGLAVWLTLSRPAEPISLAHPIDAAKEGAGKVAKDTARVFQAKRRRAFRTKARAKLAAQKGT